MARKKEIITTLFESGVVSVAQPDQPFWRSTGRLAAVKIRTQRILENDDTSASATALADTASDSPMLITRTLGTLCKQMMDRSQSYRTVIERSVEFLMSEPTCQRANAVAGSPHNGWLFSIPIAQRLELPHAMIFDDKKIVLYHEGRSSELNDALGKKFLLVGDIIGGGNTYNRVWLPAINETGGSAAVVYNIIDRRQGGSDRLVTLGIPPFSLCDTDATFFREAFDYNLIDQGQLDFVLAYIADPIKSMLDFVREHPDFITKSLEGDERTKAAAMLCLEHGYYTAK
ncbi:MAG TPA: hypothetical protein PK629_03740 [Oscillospiraceae bacterium]|nr:hypothetical protein [Oscillospiraceae bacterium]HPF55530.1 hypothetical protein [Clostridiales bacterium]HPK35696.1 hypothetical protein [Oscillospiraceae bacterium]HPR76393.1 hypothetical protein [Oscillospiraceae bacterium]